MCGLYGVLSYGDEIKDMAEITEALAIESAVRGTDATGYAYNSGGHINVQKKSKSAYEMNFTVPKHTAAVMGHTRHATQGTIKFNGNNHPFRGRCGNTDFALAHNGILCNDRELRKELKLPKTKIETDSYIAVQLIESKKHFDFDTIKYLAEAVDGSFSFSILDDMDNLYLIKGDSPITLFHFPSSAVYVYASTLSILWKALVDTELFRELQLGEYEEIGVDDGEILKICSTGEIECEKFKFDATASYGLDWRTGYNYDLSELGNGYIDDIKAVAQHYGYDSEEIDTLLTQGFSIWEVEDLIYNGCLEV